MDKNRSSSLVVIIPTLNRERRLRKTLHRLQSQILIPSLVVIVDASDKITKFETTELPVELIKSSIKSAAIQRNIGIEFVLNLNQKFDFCAFLDDDVEFQDDYFDRLVGFIREKNAIGVSGLAISQNEHKRNNNFALRMLGITGKPGELTKAGINIPVRGTTVPTKVDWLIGCSLWRMPRIESVRFQSDFFGASIFEDVLFSVEASKNGELWVNPEVILKHELAKEERQSNYQHHRQWARNRWRLKSVSSEKISFIRFLLVNILYAGNRLVRADLKSAAGCIVGTYEALLG